VATVSTIICAGYVSERDIALDNSCGRFARMGLIDRAAREAAEGRPIVRTLVLDDQCLQRCDTSDNYVVLVECEADG
jgi:hypothetical protein